MVSVFFTFCLFIRQIHANSPGMHYSPLVQRCSSSSCPILSSVDSLDNDKCLSVSGFSVQNFEGNGIYCSTYQIQDMDSKNNSQESFFHVIEPEQLRYEISMSQIGNETSWHLLRVIRSKTGKWFGTPLYSAIPSSTKSLDFESNITAKEALSTSQEKHYSYQSVQLPLSSKWDWISVSFHPANKKYVEDLSEPKLTILLLSNPTPFLISSWSLQNFLKNKIDVCILSKCDEYVASFLDKNKDKVKRNEFEYCDRLEQLAQVAKVSGNNIESYRRLERAKKCILRAMEDEVARGKAVSRIARWNIAQVNMHMVHSLVRSGFNNLFYMDKEHPKPKNIDTMLLVDKAINLITEALSYSPEEKQRRMLLLDMGDLILYFKNDSEQSLKYYQNARDAVIKWNSQEKTQNNDFEFYLDANNKASIGEILKNIESHRGTGNNSFIKFRSSLIRTGNTQNLKRKENDFWWISADKEFGNSCKVEAHNSIYSSILKVTGIQFCANLEIV